MSRNWAPVLGIVLPFETSVRVVRPVGVLVPDAGEDHHAGPELDLGHDVGRRDLLVDLVVPAGERRDAEDLAALVERGEERVDPVAVEDERPRDPGAEEVGPTGDAVLVRGLARAVAEVVDAEEAERVPSVGARARGEDGVGEVGREVALLGPRPPAELVAELGAGLDVAVQGPGAERDLEVDLADEVALERPALGEREEREPLVPVLVPGRAEDVVGVPRAVGDVDEVAVDPAALVERDEELPGRPVDGGRVAGPPRELGAAPEDVLAAEVVRQDVDGPLGKPDVVVHAAQALHDLQAVPVLVPVGPGVERVVEEGAVPAEVEVEVDPEGVAVAELLAEARDDLAGLEVRRGRRVVAVEEQLVLVGGVELLGVAAGRGKSSP